MPTDLYVFVPVSFVLEEDVPDIPPPALAAVDVVAETAAAAVDDVVYSSPAGHIPAAAEAAHATRTTMEADRRRYRRERAPPIAAAATSWPGCPTRGGAWSAAAPGLPGRSDQKASYHFHREEEGLAEVDRPGGGGRAAEEGRDTPSSPFSPFGLGKMNGRTGEFGLSVTKAGFARVESEGSEKPRQARCQETRTPLCNCAFEVSHGT